MGKKHRLLIVTDDPDTVLVIKPRMKLRGTRPDRVIIDDRCDYTGMTAAEVAKLAEWYATHLVPPVNWNSEYMQSPMVVQNPCPDCGCETQALPHGKVVCTNKQNCNWKSP